MDKIHIFLMSLLAAVAEIYCPAFTDIELSHLASRTLGSMQMLGHGAPNVQVPD